MVESPYTQANYDHQPSGNFIRSNLASSESLVMASRRTQQSSDSVRMALHPVESSRRQEYAQAQKEVPTPIPYSQLSTIGSRQAVAARRLESQYSKQGPQQQNTNGSLQIPTLPTGDQQRAAQQAYDNWNSKSSTRGQMYDFRISKNLAHVPSTQKSTEPFEKKALEPIAEN